MQARSGARYRFILHCLPFASCGLQESACGPLHLQWQLPWLWVLVHVQQTQRWFLSLFELPWA